MKKTDLVHSFLFAIFPIVFLFAQNQEQASFAHVVLPLVISFNFVVILFLIFRIFFTDTKKIGIIISLIMVLFFSYGHIYGLVVDKQIGEFIFGRHRYLMMLYGIVFVLGFYFILKTSRDLTNFIKILNLTSFILVFISLINVISFNFSSSNIFPKDGDTLKASDSLNNENSPDIYYFIFDEYANASTLKEVYGYESDLPEYLENKGFFVAYEGTSNYGITFWSLMSSLNMEYVNDLSDSKNLDAKYEKGLLNKIKNNKVVNFLKSKDYKYVHFESGMEITGHNSYADINIKCGNWNNFLDTLIQTTALNPSRRFLFVDSARERILCDFDTLKNIAEIDGPKFVFVHFVSPHAPFLFGENGEIVSEDKLYKDETAWENKDNYINQVKFLNKKIKETVDNIFLKSKKLPVIVIQGDHGPSLTFSKDDKGNWLPPTDSMLQERLRILNAYYLPNGGNKMLYKDIQPVNTFRTIFNFYFKSDYKILDNLSYFINYTDIYKLFDVTDVVKYNNKANVGETL